MTDCKGNEITVTMALAQAREALAQALDSIPQEYLGVGGTDPASREARVRVVEAIATIDALEVK